MRKLLTGKNAFITGTNRGMGLSMLEKFAENGACVWAHARSLTPEFKKKCGEISGKYGVEVRPVCFELTDYDSMKEAVRDIFRSKIPVDILVNNAGVTANFLFSMTPADEVRRQMEVNFFAPYFLTQQILKIMTRYKSGSIVNIASAAALDPTSGKSAYGASKAALIAMTRSVSAENGEKGIRANCIAPGIVETDMLDTLPEYIIQEIKDTTALGRPGKPENIADAAVFLASDLSSHITGQVLRVDGGM